MEPLDSDFNEFEGQLIPDQDEKMWATFAHLGIVAGLIIPLGNIWLPLVLWIINKDKSAFVRENAKEALNFQITMLLAAIVGGILAIILIGFLVIAAVVVVDIVFSIMAAMKANQGESYVYPFSLRLIK
ncbi:MAG TPA: DUF4870 domain-containing protein [Saprospiraceae bacterium]|nr:DUF4870 domain-containing protein [Saprospiraceae bacterium]HMQ81746.1 DUF4870 domain-containing protein [Saprospiraceae bacterium]